jgi:hypothetical protein
MAPYNFRLLKDELSLTGWLCVGAAAQVLFSLAAPTRYALVPVAVVFAVRALDFVLQTLGLMPNYYLKGAVTGRHSVMFPNKDGSRPEEMGTKPVAMFLVGIRSNSPLGRLSPAYRKLNDYMDKLYEDAESNRVTNGYLGRTPDWINMEYSQNNTLCSISYWSSIEELQAFSHRPVHLASMKFLGTVLRAGQGAGVIHEIMVCPEGHWEGLYANAQPWGFGATRFPVGKGGALQPPIYERDLKQLNGMWGRMGNRVKQAEADEKLAAIVGNVEEFTGA